MSIRINEESMTLEVDGRVVVTGHFRRHAAGDRGGAWIVSAHPARLFTRNEAITALGL